MELGLVAHQLREQGVAISYLAACRTFHEPAANPVDWPIFQLLFAP